MLRYGDIELYNMTGTVIVVYTAPSARSDKDLAASYVTLPPDGHFAVEKEVISKGNTIDTSTETILPWFAEVATGIAGMKDAPTVANRLYIVSRDVFVCPLSMFREDFVTVGPVTRRGEGPSGYSGLRVRR